MPTTPYGKGEFTNLADPKPLTDDTGRLAQGEPVLHGTPKQPMPPVSSGPNPVSDQKISASMKKSAVTSDGKS